MLHILSIKFRACELEIKQIHIYKVGRSYYF